MPPTRWGGFHASTEQGIIVVDLQRPDTHWFWYVSRAAGLSAYLALTLSVVWGLLLSTNVADKWIARGRSVELHKWISAVALALIVAHALVLVGDPYIRFDLVDVLVPFAAEYRPLAVALGVVSAYGERDALHADSLVSVRWRCVRVSRAEEAAGQ